jgi:hypothetical protein
VEADPAQEITPPSSPTGRIARLLPWAPLVLAGAYLIALLVQFGQIVEVTYLDADAASAPVIGQLYGGAVAHREVVLGQMAWFSTLMFELATRWLPLHRQIWEAAPYAMTLASAALIAWGLWHVAGRWAATVGGTLVVCAAPHTLHLLFSLNDHSPTWFSLALLAGMLVLLERDAEGLKTVWAVVVVVGVGAIVGANMASDTLLVGAGFVPVLLAVAGVRMLPDVRTDRRALLLILLALAVACVAAALTRLLMHNENVIVPPEVTHTRLASAEALTSNFKLWWQSIAVLGNGEFFGETLGLTSALQVACAGISILAVVVLVPRIAWRELARHLRTDRPGAPGETDAPKIEAPRIAWCIFWGSSAILLSAGFVVSSTPVDIESDRYLVGLIYAAAALVPLLGATGTLRRGAISAGATVFAFTGLLSLVQGTATDNVGHFPSAGASAQVARIARREHLTVGYAGYWDAAPITWATHFAVKVYPVQKCGGQLCQFYIHYISSWYDSRPGLRTFLIDDPTQPVAAAPVAALGKPSAVYQIDELTMYVYPYDIASRLQP